MLDGLIHCQDLGHFTSVICPQPSVAPFAVLPQIGRMIDANRFVTHLDIVTMA
jgi:hypothetical protein